MLLDVDDEMDILIPIGGEFDGRFKTPCVYESGVSEIVDDTDQEQSIQVFVLVPCGFFEPDEEDYDFSPN